MSIMDTSFPIYAKKWFISLDLYREPLIPLRATVAEVNNAVQKIRS